MTFVLFFHHYPYFPVNISSMMTSRSPSTGTALPEIYRVCLFQGAEVSMVSRGDSTLRGHFPSDLVSLEKGAGGE